MAHSQCLSCGKFLNDAVCEDCEVGTFSIEDMRQLPLTRVMEILQHRNKLALEKTKISRAKAEASIKSAIDRIKK